MMKTVYVSYSVLKIVDVPDNWNDREIRDYLEGIAPIVPIIVLMQNFLDDAPSTKSLNGVCGVFLWRMVGVGGLLSHFE